MALIYLARNIITDKLYVGQTWYSLQQRIDAHIQQALAGTSKSVFHRAIRKYGSDCFEWSVLKDDIQSQELLDAYECEFINSCNTLVPNGYNLMSGGSYGKHHASSKEKVSIGNTGKIRSEAFKKRVSEVHTGKVVSKETRAKIAAKTKGKRRSLETRKRISENNRNRIVSAATREKMSQSRMGHVVTEGARRKSSEKQKGKTLTKEHINNMRAAALRRAPMSDETKQKLSESMKQYRQKQKQLQPI